MNDLRYFKEPFDLKVKADKHAEAGKTAKSFELRYVAAILDTFWKPDTYFPTGSRYFGVFHLASDYDFYCLRSEEALFLPEWRSIPWDNFISYKYGLVNVIALRTQKLFEDFTAATAEVLRLGCETKQEKIDVFNRIVGRSQVLYRNVDS